MGRVLAIAVALSGILFVALAYPQQVRIFAEIFCNSQIWYIFGYQVPEIPGGVGNGTVPAVPGVPTNGTVPAVPGVPTNGTVPAVPGVPTNGTVPAVPEVPGGVPVNGTIPGGVPPLPGKFGLF